MSYIVICQDSEESWHINTLAELIESETFKEQAKGKNWFKHTQYRGVVVIMEKCEHADVCMPRYLVIAEPDSCECTTEAFDALDMPSHGDVLDSEKIYLFALNKPHDHNPVTCDNLYVKIKKRPKLEPFAKYRGQGNVNCRK